MDFGGNWLALVFSAGALLVSFLAHRHAKRALDETLRYGDAVFKVIAYRSNDSYTGVLLGNRGETAANDVRVEFCGEVTQEAIRLDEDDLTYSHDVVAKGDDVWLSTPLGEAGRVAAFSRGLTQVRVRWVAMSRAPREQVLNLPLVAYQPGPSFVDPD